MAQCITPYMLKDQQITVPCGKCPPCRQRRIGGWAVRLNQEQKISKTSFFLTLTYNTDNVPITKNGYMSLKKKDVQDFIKRLRVITERNKNQDINYGYIRYYACGEYGTKGRRPHYHLIIFNTHPDNIEKAWKIKGKEIGTIDIDTVNEASIRYTFKYLQKESKIAQHKNDDRKKEFQLFSKGLGKNYLTKSMIKWHLDDVPNRMFVPIQDNKKVSMPRYYKNRIYDDFQKLLVKDKMQELANKAYQELQDKYGENLQKVLHERRVAQFKKMYKNSKTNLTL